MKISFGTCALGCGFTIIHDGLCASCTRKLAECLARFQALDRCRTCGAPILFEGATCRHAEDCHLIFRVGPYRSILRRLLLAYKKSGNKSLALLLARVIHAYVETLFDKIPTQVVLIPVPCSKRSLRIRGWDQVLVLAGVLSHRYGYRVSRLLEHRGSVEQKLLSKLQRFGTAEHSFSFVARGPLCGADEIPVVLDDVMTTGATLSRCIALVEEHTGRQVFGLCVAMH